MLQDASEFLSWPGGMHTYSADNQTIQKCILTALVVMSLPKASWDINDIARFEEITTDVVEATKPKKVYAPSKPKAAPSRSIEDEEVND